MKTQDTSLGRPQRGFSMERWRKLYVSAVEAPHEDMGDTEPSSNLARIFVVLLLVHVFLIGAIVLYNIFSDHSRGASADATPQLARTVATPTPTLAVSQPKPKAPKPNPTVPGHHLVVSGDSLASIAQKYGIDQQALIRENHIGGSNPFRTDLDLLIPPKSVPAPSNPSAPQPASAKVSQVMKTPPPLATVKLEVNNAPPGVPAIPVARLVKRNPPPPADVPAPPALAVQNTPPHPKPGDLIATGGSGNSKAQDNPPQAKTVTKSQEVKPKDSTSQSSKSSKSGDKVAGAVRYHTVTSSDTLYGLAKKYKVKVDDIMKLNGITDPKKLRDGIKIKIPAPKNA